VGLLVLAAVLIGPRLGDTGGIAEPDSQAAADFALTPLLTVAPARSGGPPPDCDTALAGDFGVVPPEALRAQGLVEFGRIVEPRSCPLQVANRADTVFIWMADGGEIDLAAAGLHRLTAFGDYYRGSSYAPSDLAFHYHGEQFRVAMWVQDEGRIAFDGTNSPNIAVQVQGWGDRIDFQRIGPSGAYASVTLEGEQSGRHRLAFASDGTLFFDPVPLPGSLATNWITGEAIDVGGMTPVGQIEYTSTGYPDTVSTGCNMTTRVCSAGMPAVALPIRLPAGGILTCVPVMSAGIEREAYELDTGEYVLRFSPSGGYGMAWTGGCATVSAWRDSPSHTVSAGDEVYTWTYTSIEAFAADGSPLSVVMTRDGHLYVGEVRLEVDCPCQIGH
jgi:hypothetical protein